MNKATKWYARLLYAVIAVALVAGLTLVPVMVPALAPVASPTVEASSVSGITVSMSNCTNGTGGKSNYTINFTIGQKLNASIGDAIVVEFPAHLGATGTNTSIINITTANTTINGTAPSNVTISGRRVSLTVGANVVGNVTLRIGTAAHVPVVNPAPEGNYTLKVYTSQEPTAVTSPSYLVDTRPYAGNVTLSPYNTSTLTAVEVNMTTPTALVQGDTVAITFPDTTTVPTSISSTSYVTVHGTALVLTSDYRVSGQTVTLVLPVSVGANINWHVNFSKGVGILNPEYIRTNWTASINTSKDRGPCITGQYHTIAANETHITKVVWDPYDPYVHNNTVGPSGFKIRTQDVNSVNATCTGTVTFTLDGGSGGKFYSTAACSSQIITITIGANASLSSTFYYKNTNAGTTAYVTAVDTNLTWTAANTSVAVSPMVQLWGGGSIIGNYTNIQNAENASVPYDTIKVFPGTYEPASTITIAVSHLTLQSTGGAAQTIINATNSGLGIDGGGINIYHTSGATNVTIDGLTVEGAGACGIYIRAGNNATIQNCVINNRYFRTGIDVNPAVSGVTISGCTINHNATITIHDSDCTVRDSTIYGEVNVWPCWANQIVNKVNITNNTFPTGAYNTSFGIAFFSTVNNTYITNSVVKGNTICNRTKSAILLWQSASANNVKFYNLTISGNTITNNSVGINITSGAIWRANNTITNNNIYNNTVYGVMNKGNYTVAAATLNYWGDSTGPSKGADTYASTAPGSGDAVSINVTFSPWRSAAYPGGFSTTNATFTLTTGWNFMSVPKKLENATFGWLLSGISFSTAWGYNASSGQWVSLSGSSAVEVLDGYWIDSNQAATVNLTLVSAGQQVPASKNLTGNKWNAIGFSNTTATTAALTLMSVNLTWSSVMGWNATSQAYDNIIIWPGAGSGNNMNPCKGYWIWMTADDTLSALSA